MKTVFKVSLFVLAVFLCFRLCCDFNLMFIGLYLEIYAVPVINLIGLISLCSAFTSGIWLLLSSWKASMWKKASVVALLLSIGTGFYLYKQHQYATERAKEQHATGTINAEDLESK